MPSTARGESAPPSSPVVFTEEGFGILLRSSFPDSTSRATADHVIETLDAAPDTAMAWVYGLYETVLGRLPQRGEIFAAAGRLRSGETADDLVTELLASDEAIASGSSERPTDLGVAYITGCYLSVFGRRPDPSGLQACLALYSAGSAEGLILQSLLESEEASVTQRFPPPTLPPEIAIGQALQSVVLGRIPLEPVSREFAARYVAGESVIALVSDLMSRDRRIRTRVRMFLTAQTVTGQVLIEAKLRQLLTESASDRAWEWRCVRRTWQILSELQDVLSARAEGGPIDERIPWRETSSS